VIESRSNPNPDPGSETLHQIMNLLYLGDAVGSFTAVVEETAVATAFCGRIDAAKTKKLFYSKIC
jgi:hypothetical protein